MIQSLKTNNRGNEKNYKTMIYLRHGQLKPNLPLETTKRRIMDKNRLGPLCFTKIPTLYKHQNNI